MQCQEKEHSLCQELRFSRDGIPSYVRGCPSYSAYRERGFPKAVDSAKSEFTVAAGRCITERGGMSVRDTGYMGCLLRFKELP